MSALPYAHGGPVATATVRGCPEDFRVVEDLGFSPSGEGQHRMVEIEKRDINSDWVATQLAKLVGIKKRDVGLAGLKDRYAVTRQWFSVDIAGKEEPEWAELERLPPEGQRLTLLQVVPHHRKLRRGALQGNHFQLQLRALEGDQAAVEQRLQQIRERGIPNYFGEQRFGRGGQNVERALQMFQRNYRPRGRHEKGLLLSAVRSELFNQLCGRRVEAGSWDQPLAGDLFALNRSRARFQVEQIDAEIEQRIAEHDIHPTGPLWGRGALESWGEVALLEQAVVAERKELGEGLEQAGLEQDRRALRLLPRQLEWRWPDPEQLELSFWLPAGSYATVLLRELVRYR
ncbi:MAG: tRNA pseudouridine(13) synthase TruD [Gammaproteobacteria bacterium]|nr:tRNA pseudouridine(13) synthase TruD [Gammaproteobacteria bacterium]